jgi:hypothetical protein
MSSVSIDQSSGAKKSSISDYSIKRIKKITLVRAALRGRPGLSTPRHCRNRNISLLEPSVYSV